MRLSTKGTLRIPYPLTPLFFSVFLSFSAHSAPQIIAHTETELTGQLLQVTNPQENIIVTLERPLTVTSSPDQGTPIEVLYNGYSFPASAPSRYVSFRNASASTQESAPALTLNDIRSGIESNRSYVIYSYLGNNTLTFFGDVSIVARHALTGSYPMVQLFGVRAVGDRINFRQNVSLTDSSFSVSTPQTANDTTSLISVFQATTNGVSSFPETGIVFGAENGNFATRIEHVTGQLHAANARMIVLNTDKLIRNYNTTTINDITFTNTGEQSVLYGVFTQEGTITNYAPVRLSNLRLNNQNTEASFNYSAGMFTGISSTEDGVVGVITNKSTVSIDHLTIDSGSSPASGDAGLFGMRAVGGQIVNEANVSISQLTQIGSTTQTSVGVQSDDPDSRVSFAANLTINGIHTSDTAHSGTAAGIRAYNDGQVTVQGQTSITDITAPKGNAYGVQSYPGVVTLNNQVIIKSLSGLTRYSLIAINDSDDNETASRITLAAAAHEIEGDIVSRRANDLSDTNPDPEIDNSVVYTEGHSEVTASFVGDTAYLKGWTHLGASTTEAVADTSTLDLTFSDGARWEMVSSNPDTLGTTPTARLSTLTLNNGHVYVGTTQEDFNNPSTLFADSASVLGSTTAPATLDVNTLSGSGDFYLRARLADNTDASDRVHVRGDATGSFTLHVKSSGNAAAPTEQTGYLVEVGNPQTSATFTLANDQPVELGLYQYTLATRDSTTRQWYLQRLTREDASERRPGPSTDPTDPTEPTPEETPVTPETPETSETTPTPNVPSTPDTSTASSQPVYSTSALALFSLGDLSAHALLNQESLNHVRYRHGSIRSRTQEGLWVDMAHHHVKSNTLEDTRTKLRFNTMTLGYDTQVGQSPWLVGAIFSTAKGDRSARHVQPTIRGDFNHWSGSLYATYLRDNGAYINLMGTVSRLSQDVDTQMIDGEPVSGKIKSRGSGVSVELGHKFDLSRLFFVEPSLQLSYGHYRAHNTVLSNGMTLTQTSFNSLTGRAGFTAGAKVWREGDLLGEVWLNAGVMREFKGESTLHVNGVAFEDTLLGTRYYYGMGADLAFTPNVKLYAVAEHQQGKLMQDSLGLKAGIKWQF